MSEGSDFDGVPQAILVSRQHANTFSFEFLEWLPQNLHVWNAFVREANMVIERGRKHYSSKTIIEFLRHLTTITQNGGEFKINDHMSPYLPRLFDLMYPQHAGLWSYRETKANKPKDAGHGE